MQRFTTIFLTAFALLLTFPFAVSADTTLVPIHLTVVTSDATLFDGDILVGECLDSEIGTTTSANAFCAIEQVASTSSWTLQATWYSFGRSLDGINSYTADFVNNRYWIYYVDGEPGMTSLNAHQLTSGEKLTLAYGINPLRVTAPTTTPEVGTTTILTGEYFDPIAFTWSVATATTFFVNGEATSSDASGTLQFIPSTTTPFIIILSKEGSLASLPLTLSPFIAAVATNTPIVVESPVIPVVGSATPDTPHTIDTQKAVLFLRALQNPDGSYGAALYTDWVSIGLSGVNGAEDIRENLGSYLKQNTNPGIFLTDIERRAMALMALGIDPSTGTELDYIKGMFEYYDGEQWGDKDEINDDIFALIPLLHAGYSTNDEMIIQTIATIISAQQSNGSWGSIDLTAAGVQALAPVSSYPGVSESVTRAKAYLSSAQELDGGYDSSFATSWVLQAITGEDLSIHWTKNGRTPQDFLWLLQQDDGGIESTALDQNSRIWATAYAIPAANGKDWNSLLGSYARTASVPVSVFGTAPEKNIGEVLGATTTATTTHIFASSTIAVGTTTSVVVNSASSTLIIASSSTPILASTSPVKKPVIVKKRIVNEAKATTSASTNIIAIPPAPVLQSSTVRGSSWGDAVIKPFIRLYQAVHSWFD